MEGRLYSFEGTNFETICLKAYEENRIPVVWALGGPSGI